VAFKAVFFNSMVLMGDSFQQKTSLSTIGFLRAWVKLSRTSV